MRSHDSTRAAQHPEPLGEPLDIPTAPPVPKPVKATRLTPLRAWWHAAWAIPDGVLYQRWEDLRQARELGWHGMARWVKLLLAVAGLSAVVLLAHQAASALADAVHQLLTTAPRVQVGTDTSTGIWAVIDQPIRSYIAQQSAGLAVSGSTIYTLWQATGLIGLIGGFFRSTAARAVWTGYGAAGTAMVWNASPAPGRALATGIAALLWTLASRLALRGLSLRPAVFTRNYHAAPTLRPEINTVILIPPALPDAPPASYTPNNTRPLQR
ncbi:hypothetical protein ACWDBO_30040 [Streptomyces mirabilis]|uniref:hypothetical protein n=1 Tax=Streptomyces mirabilis TaxID=68239 RepID=UPI003324036D